jgi:TIR domain-containing protein
MHPIKAFISFCSADRVLAQRLQKDLATAGCASWQFDISAVPGTDAWEAILEQIEQSEFFLVLLSEAATQSRGVMEEISHAHYCSLNSPSSMPRIIPVLLRDGVTVPRKIVRLVRLPFRENTYDADFAPLLHTLGIEASPFQTATALEVSSTRAYEFEADREAVRYATSLINNNQEIAASFQKLTARTREVGVNFYVLPAQVITRSEEVSRYYTSPGCTSTGPAVCLRYTFWVFFGLTQKHTKGYTLFDHVVMQINASQDRRFEDIGDDRLLKGDSLQLRFEGFHTITAAPLPSDT